MNKIAKGILIFSVSCIVLGGVLDIADGGEKQEEHKEETAVAVTTISETLTDVAESTTTAVDKVVSINGYSFAYGEIIDVTASDSTLIVKGKVNYQATNKLTINQNYMNAVQIINQGGKDYEEIQYWAVDEHDNKIISFTVDKSLIDATVSGNVVDIMYGDYVSDLYILPALN